MRAVAYCRVSSSAQRDRHTIESQYRIIPEFIERQGWTLARPIGAYVDDGRSAKSGKLEAREAYQRLVEDARAGQFDVVVVVDLDRLTRSEDLTERGAILGAFQRAGVRIAVASTGQVLDLSSSLGDLYGSLQAVFAAEENRKRRERTVQGKLTAIARGHKPSGPTPYGLRYSRVTRSWSIDDETGSVVRDIYQRVVAGENCRAIADDLARCGVPTVRGRAWDRARVYAIARSTTYRGIWVADKTRKLEVKVPAIVSESTWYAAQDLLMSWNRRGLRRTKHIYLLEGLALCSICGAKIGVASSCRGGPRSQPSAATYVCSARRRPATPDGARCHLPHRKVEEVDARIWAAICELVERPDVVEEVAEARRGRSSQNSDAWTKDITDFEGRLSRLAKAESAILSRFRQGLISEAVMDADLAAGAKQRAMLERQLEGAQRALTDARKTTATAVALESVLKSLRKRVRRATLAERQALVQLLVEPGGVVLGSYEIAAQVRLEAGPQEVGRAAQAG